MTRIAVIGGGRIGEALLAGLLESGRSSEDLVVVEAMPARAEVLGERLGIRVTDSVAEAAAEVDLVVIAVKPGDVDEVLTEFGQVLEKQGADGGRPQVLASLAAGI